MALIIVAAENEFLKNAAFSLRHQVFAEEQSVFKKNELRKISDRFDLCPSTTNFVGFSNTVPVASYRISLDGPLGLPVEEYYDLSSIKNLIKGERIGLISLGCIERNLRSQGVYPKCVYQMGKTLSDLHCDYGAVVIRKDLAESFSKWGFVSIEDFYCQRVKQILSKMCVEMKNYGKNFSQFASVKKVKNFRRKMTIFLQEGEVFPITDLKSYHINSASHLRLVSGEIKLLWDKQNVFLESLDMQSFNDLPLDKIKIVSHADAEIEILMPCET
ncbi:MAG: N-acyl amino acid synthase FeeM domain-containing protein [Pseudobdellovibrionaceae bacterium]